MPIIVPINIVSTKNRTEPLGVEALAGSPVTPPSSRTAFTALFGVTMAGLEGFSPCPISGEEDLHL